MDKTNNSGLFQIDELEGFIRANSKMFQEKVSLKELLDLPRYKLIEEDSNAFLFGLISDQSVKAEVAWSLPYSLKQRIGGLAIEAILDLGEEEIIKAIKRKPSLHRFPSSIGEYIFKAAEKLNESYDKKASLIWGEDSSAGNILVKLKEFKGIGHKKASLGLSLLIREFDEPITEKSRIDIAYDLHIRRIFIRSGLTKKDTENEIVKKAQEINHQYPGELTSFFWHIGRNWCFASKPNCIGCPLTDYCKKNI